MRALFLPLLLLWPPTHITVAPPPPAPVGPEIAVNVATVGSHSGPHAAIFADGGFVVAWTDTGGGKSVAHARLFDSQGSPRSGEFLLGAPLPGSSVVTAVVADAGDSFLVARDYTPPGKATRVLVARFARSGKPIGAAVQASVENSHPRFGGRIALRPGGGFAVAWTAEDDFLTHVEEGLDIYAYDVHARIFSAGGKPLGPEFTAAGGFDDQIAVGVAVRPDGSLNVLYLTWVELYALALRQVAADGSSFAPGELINGEVPQNLAALSLAPGGGLTIAWSPFGFGDQVKARRFTADGTPEGAEIRVDGYGGGGQALGDLAPLPDGGFVAVWTDFKGRDGDHAGIFARAFAGDGTPLNAEDLPVNLTTAGNQFAPTIAGRNGRFVAVWSQGDPIKQNDLEVRARLLGCGDRACP